MMRFSACWVLLSSLALVAGNLNLLIELKGGWYLRISFANVNILQDAQNQK